MCITFVSNYIPLIYVHMISDPTTKLLLVYVVSVSLPDDSIVEQKT